MALGFLPPSSGEWEQKVCDDDTTNGDDKTASGDLQLFMQYFNPAPLSSLVVVGVMMTCQECRSELEYVDNNQQS